MDNSQKAKKLYRWGWAGLIPNFGFIVGIFLIVKGISYKNRKLILIGAVDILFSVIIWVSIEPIIYESHLFDKTHTENAKRNLNLTVKNIEFYKIKFGVYPEKVNFGVISEETNSGFNEQFVNDPFLRDFQSLQYHRIRNKYKLFSVGADKTPNTDDDLYPTITNGDTIKFGLIK